MWFQRCVTRQALNYTMKKDKVYFYHSWYKNPEICQKNATFHSIIQGHFTPGTEQVEHIA
jgi:hypothetical protein